MHVTGSGAIAVPEDPPLVSVCLPVYNGREHLLEAIFSVFGQSYPNLELLVFDDASTDGSWEILHQIQDPRIHLFRHASNLGPAGNWNHALKAANGTYVKLFHQDDLLAANCLEEQVAALERCPKASLAFCARNIIGPDGKVLGRRSGPWPDGEVDQTAVLRACILAGTNLVGEPSAVLFRRATAHLAGEFSGEIPYLIDLDYWMRLMDQGPACCLSSTLASFRISPRQWSAVIGGNQGRQFVQFMEKIAASGRLRLSAFEWQRGKAMAHKNQFLRRAAYLYLHLQGGFTRAWSRLDRLVRFILVGGTNTLLSYLVFAGGLRMGLHYGLATLIANCFGMALGFHLHGRFSFADPGSGRFHVFASLFLLTYGLSVGAQSIARQYMNGYLAGAAAAALTIPISYLLNRTFVFHTKADRGRVD